EIDFAEVPESVKPKPEKTSEARLLYATAPQQSKPKPAALGYAIAACLFVLVFAVMFFSREKIAKAWPPAALLYETIGVPVTVGPQGLAFMDVTVKTAPAEGGDGEFINIAGRLMNATAKPAEMPYIEASLRDKAGKNLARNVIEPLHGAMIPAGEGTNF